MAVDYDTVKKRKYFGQVSYEYERAGAFEEGRLISREWWKKDVEERVKALCTHEGDSYYLVFHDKDTWEQKGKIVPKPLHAHFVFDFKNARAWTSVQKAMKISRSENLSSTVRSMTKTCRYLTHRTEAAMSEGKWQYEMTEVITNRDYAEIIKGGSVRSLANNERSSDGLMIDEFCLDLSYKIQEKGMLPTEAKAELYREFPELNAQKAWDKNRRIFENNRLEFIETEFKRLQRGGRNHVAFYIEGNGEAGKSWLARTMGELHEPKLGTHNPSINKTRLDLGSNYRGNKTLVLDEFDASSSMGYRELFKLLEPDSVSQLSSRFKDVMLINDMTIFTHSLDYLEWVDWWFVGASAQYQSLLHQMFRRIRYQIHIKASTKKRKTGIVMLSKYEGVESKGSANKDDLKPIREFHIREYTDAEFARIACEILKIAGLEYDQAVLDGKLKKGH